MQPKIYTVSDHDIDPNLIDPDALYVLTKLRKAGFIAYLVGGSVRDLLLKRVPKDFDISTSALPEEIKQLFQRQCLLIGRRFRLAHIRFGHKIIEVSTFRSGESEETLIIRDNQWGTPEEDVLRRDFTINGLFYDPSNHSIIDYVGGWDDIHNGLLQSIGNSEIRFKQDPVRMIRLLKFRARFGFNIAQDAGKALFTCRNMILKSSPARVLEEMLRMLEIGASAPFFNLLLESGLLNLLYPEVVKEWARIGKSTLLYLTAADQINQSLGKKSLDRALLLAIFLFPWVEHQLKIDFLDKEKMPHLGEVIAAVSTVIQRLHKGGFAVFPRRLTAIASTLLTMQYRFTPSSGKIRHHPKILKQKEFSLALQLFKIRALVDKSLIENYTSWKVHYRRFQRQSDRKGHLPHHNPPFHVDVEGKAQDEI